MERTISHYCPMKLQKVCMYILLCCSGALLMSKLQPYGAAQEPTDRSVKTLGVVAGPVHVTTKKKEPVGGMHKTADSVEAAEPMQAHDDSKDQPMEAPGTKFTPLRGQGGLKNGPDTEFLFLGGNLSLVSP